MERIIFNNLLYNEEFARQVVPHISPEYFYDRIEKKLYLYIHKFFDKYNKLPTKAVLEMALERDSSVSDTEFENGITLIKSLKNSGDDLAWLVDETEKFCKERSLFNALSSAVKIKENNEKPFEQRDKKLPDVSAIPDIMSKALAVSFDKSVGHDYLEDFETRWEVYHDKATKIPFDIDILNKITKGGVESKTLNILMAGVNTGKSLGLCHLAASYISMGYDVLYVSMEMGEIQGVAKRIDANLLDMTMDKLETLDETTYHTRIKSLKDKIVGKLVIKQYPTASAHVGHISALLNELALKKNFRPRILIVDYLGIMCSKRMTGYSENSYHMVKTIAEELRGLGIEEDLCVWSAAQTNRGSWGNSDMEMADVAESAGLPATADFMLGIVETEETIAQEQQLFKQIKSRYGNKDINTRFMVGVSKEKQKWYEVNRMDAISSMPTATMSEHKAKIHGETGKGRKTKTDVTNWKL